MIRDIMSPKVCESIPFYLPDPSPRLILFPAQSPDAIKLMAPGASLQNAGRVRTAEVDPHPPGCGSTSCILKNQYFGIDGSTELDQAVIPPLRFSTFVRPAA